MRKQYLKPEIELIQFNYRDIVAATGSSEDSGNEELPITKSFGVFSFATMKNESESSITPDNNTVWSE